MKIGSGCTEQIFDNRVHWDDSCVGCKQRDNLRQKTRRHSPKDCQLVPEKILQTFGHGYNDGSELKTAHHRPERANSHQPSARLSLEGFVNRVRPG